MSKGRANDLHISSLAKLPPSQRAAILAALTNEEAAALLYDWSFLARDNQLPPPGAWSVWMLLAGRGFGKTRTGAEFIRSKIESGQWGRVALVARTAADARDVMVEGESGLLAVCPPWFKAEYEPSKRRITFPNGAIATTYSGDKPDQLRGPQHDGAWCDELAAWRYPEAWDMLQFGLRLGDHPQTVVTTTPRPTRLIRQLVNEPDTVLTTGSTYDNAANLPPQILEKFRRRYEGTRLGLQELYAKLLDDAPGALWKRSTIENSRVSTFPDLIRIAVAIDPAVSDGEESAETGIIAAGVSRNGHGFILDDATISASPADWARQAISTYSLHRGDIIVAEVNNGGDMVENTIRTVRDAADNPIGRNIPFKQVRASRGKLTRAEPIAALYEQGRVHHVGVFSELEDQMCQWVPGDKSPDRLDAAVWALTELMIDDAGELRLGSAPDALKDWFGA